MSIREASGRATYEVRYTFKKVRGSSQQLTGKIEERGDKQAFELIVPIKSFLSDDKDLDQHMREVTRPESFPEARARGEVSKDVWTQEKATISAHIEFHGVTRAYNLHLDKKATRASFMLNLEAHGIERPSLLGIKIKNEVLVTFELNWK